MCHYAWLFTYFGGGVIEVNENNLDSTLQFSGKATRKPKIYLRSS